MKVNNMIKMNNLKSYFNLVICISALMSSTVIAQDSPVQASQKIDGTASVNNESPHSLYAGIGYGSNMIYMGSTVSQNDPYYSGSLTYGYDNKFFASVSTNHLSAFDPFLDFSAFSLSYNHDLNSWLDISPGVSRYQVKNELADTLFSNFTYGYLTLGFDWNILYTGISAGGILSDTNSIYFNLKNSRYIQTSKLFKGKSYFYFDPYVTMLFGTLTKTVTAEGTIIGVSTPFRPKGSGNGGGGSGNGVGGGGSSSSVTTSTFFSLMEVDFGLPVGCSGGKLTLEAEPGYILPAYSGTDVLYPKGFTLLLNCYLKIF